MSLHTLAVVVLVVTGGAVATIVVVVVIVAGGGMGYYPAPNAKTEKNPTPELYITHSLTHSLQKMETLGLSVKNSKHKYTFQFAHCNFHAIFNHFPTHWIRPSMGWHFWISFRYRFLANIIYIYYIYIEGGVKSILLRWLIVWPVRFGDEFSPLPQCC